MRHSVCLIEHAAQRLDSDFRIMRLCEWAGYSLGDFSRYTIHDESNIQLPPGQRVYLPLGPLASGVFTKLPFLSVRGYVLPLENGTYAVPTVSPGFVQRGNAKWSAAFINDIQKAALLAEKGMPMEFQDYTLDPSPAVAYEWAREYRRELQRCEQLRLAFDIETPGKGEDEESIEIGEAPDKTWHIWRIGFSYRGLHALSVPWEAPFIPAIRLLLDSPGDKIVWNAGFDVPRVRRAGIPIGGVIHDGMVAWHILHSDLYKKLGFVATFTCPWQAAWKHLSGSKPAFYNATDADVEWRSMEAIERELRANGLWEVYQRDVLELEPVLAHMHMRGMPVDLEVRLDRSKRLSSRLQDVRASLAELVPLEARKIEHVYVKPPKDTSGLLVRPSIRQVPVCRCCRAIKPRKEHFRSYIKKHNQCANAGTINIDTPVEEFYRLAEFTPSRDQLIRYHQHLKRPLPTVYDRKERKRRVSFGEKQIMELQIKYPLDQVYPLVLEYRALDKIAGTYIGRPAENMV